MRISLRCLFPEGNDRCAVTPNALTQVYPVRAVPYTRYGFRSLVDTQLLLAIWHSSGGTHSGALGVGLVNFSHSRLLKGWLLLGLPPDHRSPCGARTHTPEGTGV